MSREAIRDYLDSELSFCLGHSDDASMRLVSFAYISGFLSESEYKYLMDAVISVIYNF